MKRKELYQFIREGIIEELSLAEGPQEDKAALDAKKNAINKEIVALKKKLDELRKKGPESQETNAKTAYNDLIKAINDDIKFKQEELKKLNQPQSTLAESDLEESRKANKIRLGDDETKITLAKELYGPETIEGRLITAIEGSEDGLTQKELETALKKISSLKISSLNPYIEKLAFAQVLAKPAKTATAEPEPTVEPEDEDDVEVQDDYEKPEEEESVPEEPKSKEEIEKDKLAQAFKNLSDEETKKFNGFLTSVKKNKDDKAKIDAILKLAKDKKFSPTLMNFLFNAAGRDSLKNI